MNKIVVLGGGGYMGSALLKVLGETYPHSWIVMVDRHYHPLIVESLPNNCIFLQVDIGDCEAMRPILEDADTVFLWAAEVEAETSKEREALVWRENYEKPCALLPLLAGKKLIVASTANLFGGGELVLDAQGAPARLYTEEDQPCPRYPYAESKASLEVAVKAEHDNYVLLRFGTNYGWAPGIRFNLVVNLFVKRAIQGLPLLLFRGGLNYRAFCATHDCARAAVFLASNPLATKKAYHVVSQNYRICEVAQLVREVSQGFSKVPPVQIEDVDREADFSSYALDSSRLRDLGFHFRWDMRGGVERLFGKMDNIKTPAKAWVDPIYFPREDTGARETAL